MITLEGKNHIKRYLAGYVPVIAQSMVFGIGNKVETIGDITLQMQATRSPINLTYYDFATNKLVYKAAIPEEYIGKIYEVGVYSLESDPTAGDFASRTISTFDSATETWMTDGGTGVFTTTRNATVTDVSTTRIGADSLVLTPVVSGSSTSALGNVTLDLSGYSNSDTFNFAFNVGNANTSNVRYRFLTDGSNFYDFVTGTQTAGYKFYEFTKGSATVTGTPNWGNITEIQITVTSSAGGASSVEFDGMRIEDKDSANLDYVLVARKVLATPVVKIPGMSQDVEFSMDVLL
jgi:hypothetical protein